MAATNYYTFDDLKKSNLISHSSGGQKSAVHGRVPSESPAGESFPYLFSFWELLAFLGLWLHLSLLYLHITFWCVSMLNLPLLLSL